MLAAPAKPKAERDRRNGILLSLGAYSAWGAFPLYFKALRAPPLEVLANRVVWSALFLALVLIGQGRVRRLVTAICSGRVAFWSFLSATLLAINWFIYIWAVTQGRVVDASLGYFITPLVSVGMGVLLFGETLRAGQRLAVGTAAAGVLWLALQLGQLPWVGLGLAFSFGSYAALRKRSLLDAFDGLILEQVLMLPFALAYLVWLAYTGQNAFQSASLGQGLLLVLSGPLSSVPLLMFAAGARLIPLSLVGVLQYISPTLQLLLGVLVWHEPFSGVKLIGYALIWLALLVYSIEGAWTAARLRRRAGLAQPG
jgi:chloramphenicol-sensitive protein RarD